jgi:hypothetical protein
MLGRLAAPLIIVRACGCGRLGYDPTAIDGGIAEDDGAPSARRMGPAPTRAVSREGSGQSWEEYLPDHVAIYMRSLL